MTRATTLCQHFEPASLATLPEPVRRYFTHAIGDQAPLHDHVRLTMAGRIKVGTWLTFHAEQEFAEHAFTWRARAGWGPFKPLHVVDSYRDGVGSIDGRLLGAIPFMHADDEHTARAAAGRLAAESIWVPAALLPGRGVTWRAESDELIAASRSVPPEQPEVRLRIDEHGAVRRVSVLRWGNVGQRDYGYIPFGAVIHAERRFGDITLPSQVDVGWWFDTPRFTPFFQATVLDARPLS